MLSDTGCAHPFSAHVCSYIQVASAPGKWLVTDIKLRADGANGSTPAVEFVVAGEGDSWDKPFGGVYATSICLRAARQHIGEGCAYHSHQAAAALACALTMHCK